MENITQTLLDTLDRIRATLPAGRKPLFIPMLRLLHEARLAGMDDRDTVRALRTLRLSRIATTHRGINDTIVHYRPDNLLTKTQKQINTTMKNEFNLLEPKIGEVFTLDGMTLRCVMDKGKEVDCCRNCALYTSESCLMAACAACDREDRTFVHFAKVQLD